MRKSIFLLILFVFVSSLQAASIEDDEKLIAESQQLDKELKVVLQEVINKIQKNNEGYPMLDEWVAEIKKSQELWLRYRDSEIQVVGHRWRSGGAGRAQTLWQIKITKERIENLKTEYDPRL